MTITDLNAYRHKDTPPPIPESIAAARRALHPTRPAEIIHLDDHRRSHHPANHERELA